MRKKLLFLLLLILITSCKKIEWNEEDTCIKVNCARPTNENISITISKKPMLEEEIDIFVVYDSGDYQGSVKVAVELPQGYQFVSSKRESTSFVAKNQKITLNVKAKAVQVGGWSILAYFEHNNAKAPTVIYAPVLKEGIDESMLTPIPPGLK